MPATQQRLATTGSFTILPNEVLNIPTGLRNHQGYPYTPQVITFTDKAPLVVLSRNADGSFDVWNLTTSSFSVTWIARYDHSIEQEPIPVPGLAPSISAIPAPTPEILQGHVSISEFSQFVEYINTVINTERTARQNGDLLKAAFSLWAANALQPIPIPPNPALRIPYIGVVTFVDQYPVGPPPNVSFDPVLLGRFVINHSGYYRIYADLVYSIEAEQPNGPVVLQLVTDPDTAAPVIPNAQDVSFLQGIGPSAEKLSFETILTVSEAVPVINRTFEVRAFSLAPAICGNILLSSSFTGCLNIERIDQGVVTP